MRCGVVRVLTCDVDRQHVGACAGHATEDTFIPVSHSQRLSDAYAGEKNFLTFAGDHNSVRPQFFYHSALIFFHNVLQCEQLLSEDPAAIIPSSRRYINTCVLSLTSEAHTPV